jgi:hypothetical protein
VHVQEEMEATIHGHFQGVFGTPGSGAFTFDHAAVGITPLDLSALELPFTEEEVLAAMRDTPSNRASVKVLCLVLVISDNA